MSFGSRRGRRRRRQLTPSLLPARSYCRDRNLTQAQSGRNNLQALLRRALVNTVDKHTYTQKQYTAEHGEARSGKSSCLKSPVFGPPGVTGPIRTALVIVKGFRATATKQAIDKIGADGCEAGK